MNRCATVTFVASGRQLLVEGPFDVDALGVSLGGLWSSAMVPRGEWNFDGVRVSSASVVVGEAG